MRRRSSRLPRLGLATNPVPSLLFTACASGLRMDFPAGLKGLGQLLGPRLRGGLWLGRDRFAAFARDAGFAAPFPFRERYSRRRLVCGFSFFMPFLYFFQIFLCAFCGRFTDPR